MPSFSIDKSGDAADGFIASALRAGMTPYVNLSLSLRETMERTGDLGLVVLIEPALPPSRREMLELDRFVENGGILMIFGTYRSPRATRELFEHFGLSFESLPIGRVAPDMAPDMAFWNACPLLYEGVYEGGPAKVSGVESLIDIWGYSVAAKLDVGKGAVYAFADGDFIKNKNLESVDAYRKGNVDFISGLLDEAAGRGAAVPGTEAGE